MQDRRATRVVPRNPVTVAIDGGDTEFEFGVVANISELGACIWTDGMFAVGDRLVLQMSFAKEPTPLQVAGRVVWGEPRKSAVSVRYGVEWLHAAGPAHGRLRELVLREA